MLIRFVDLFSGIGGFRLALERLGWECVAFSEIDDDAIDVYKENFDISRDVELGDITKLDIEAIPKFDVLCGGLPCQSFSMCGKRLGFEDARGTLFFDVLRILKEKRPRVFILENVKGLLSHDNGKTLRVILGSLGKTINRQTMLFTYKDTLGYNIFYKVLNALDFGLPQFRERVFIVGFLDDVDFCFPNGNGIKPPNINDVLFDDVGDDYDLNPTPSRKKIIIESKKLNECDYAYTITTKQDRIPNAGIVRKSNGWYRFLTPKEALLCQGFPPNFVNGKSKEISYRLIGNSIPIPIIEAIGEAIKYEMKGEC